MTQVSVIAVRALAAALEEAGVGRAEFLAAAGVSAEWLEREDARITLSDYAHVRRAALALTRDPALGLHLGERCSSGRYGVLGYLAEQSESLREALQMVARYARIIVQGPQLELCEEESVFTVRCTDLIGRAPEIQLTAEFVTVSLLQFVRRFVGAAAEATNVYFAFEPPPHRHEYARVFGGRERFGHSFTGIEFDRTWLDRSTLSRSPELYRVLQAQADQMLATIEHEVPAAERVRRLLAGQDLDTRPTMDTVARELGMSARSLRRRLVSEHAHYSELVEDARAMRAKSMLSQRRYTIQEAAYALGFGTPAAFSRAFKRWTGLAPSAYRGSG